MGGRLGRQSALRIGVIAFVAVVAGNAPAVAQRLQTAPQTLVTVPKPIDAFAQDGEHIAWAIRGGPCGTLVRVRALSTGSQTAFASGHGTTCRLFHHQPTRVQALALAGGRALWYIDREVTGGQQDGYPVTASTRDPVDRFLGVVASCSGQCMAGDGRVLVYSSGASTYRVLARRVRLLPGRKEGRVRAVAAAAGRIAALRDSSYEADSSPVWSPDGRDIAYVRESAPDDGDGAIYVARADGSGFRCLSPKSVWYDSPAWSRDGKQIAFMHRGEPTRDATLGVWVMNSDGSARTPLLPLLNEGPSAQSWSPDSRKLVFGGISQIYTINADRSGLARLIVAPMSAFSYARWSPDGRRIAFVGRTGGPPQLYLVNADGTGQRKLTDFAGDTDTRDPQWSPDGTRIAFTSLDGSSDSTARRVHVIDAEGGVQTMLAPATSSAARWSPDGSSIAFTGSADHTLYVASSRGGEVRELATDAYGVPSWSPDGTEVAFATGEGWIDAVTSDGRASRQITHPEGPSRMVDIDDAVTRRRLRSATVLSGFSEVASEQASAVALSRSLVVVLRRTAAKAWLEVRDVATLHMRRRIDVPHGIEPPLSISGRRIVYSVGQKIEAADAVTGRSSLLAVAASTPIGPSIEGRRVAWAENVRGHATIRAVFLPR